MKYDSPQPENRPDRSFYQKTTGARDKIPYLLCLLFAVLMILFLSMQVNTPGNQSAANAAAMHFARPIQGVDFVRHSSMEFVFCKPPAGASWLVTTIHPDASIRMWDFFRENDRCTVAPDAKRIFIYAATDEVMSYPLEVEGPEQYVQTL